MAETGTDPINVSMRSRAARSWRRFRKGWMLDTAIVLWSPFLLWLLVGLMGLPPWPEGPLRLYGEGLGMLVTAIAISLLTRHRWLGPTLSLVYGGLVATLLWQAHGAWCLMSTGQCLLIGDRGAGVFFFAMSVLGAVIGYRLGPMSLERRHDAQRQATHDNDRAGT